MGKVIGISGGWLASCAIMSLLAAAGCAKIPANGNPVYLKVDSATVSTDIGVYGSASSRIPDVWVETGAQELGAYQTPVQIPILADGDVRLLLSAGIYENGVVSTRVSYPFYRPDTLTIHQAVAGQVYSYHPVYHYFPSTRVGFKEDFTNATGFTHMSRVQGDLEGGCGAIHMLNSDTVTIAVQSNAAKISTHGREAYLEINYKTSDSVGIYTQVGIAATNGSGTIFHTLSVLKPSSQWKKVYFNFSDWLGRNQDSGFQVYFSASKDQGREGTFYVDNIKLLYFD